MSDRHYHEWRARDELERAEEASDPAIANVHRELAALHRRRLIAPISDESAQLNSILAKPHGAPEHTG